MKTKIVLPIGLIAALAGCATTSSRPEVAAPMAVSGPVPPPPTSVPPTRPHFLWLEQPSATSAEVVGLFEIIAPKLDRRDPGLEQAALAIGADALMRLPDEAIVRRDLSASAIAPSLSIALRPAELRKVRYAALRFRSENPFVVGYYDDISRRFVSGQEGSLYRFAPGRSYQNFGRYVRSPFAPDRPPVNVVGLPDGATVICPYTNRLFQLW